MSRLIFLKTLRHDVGFRMKMQERTRNYDLDLKRTEIERFTAWLREIG
jgi:hypothetical protein